MAYASYTLEIKYTVFKKIKENQKIMQIQPENKYRNAIYRNTQSVEISA